MLRLDKVIKPWKESASLNDHINLYGFWNDTAFLTKSGDVGMVLSVPGVDYESLDRSEQEYAVKRLEAALKAFGPGFHVYQYLFKSNRPDIPFAKYDDPIVAAAIEQRRKFFEAKRDYLYQVEIFYCILLEGLRSKTGVGAAFSQLFRDPAGAIGELKAQFTNDNMKTLLRSHIERDVAQLDQRVQAFARQLADFMQIEVLNRQGQFTFFRRLLNFDDWRIAGKPQSTQFLDYQVVNSNIEAERDHSARWRSHRPGADHERGHHRNAATGARCAVEDPGQLSSHYGMDAARGGQGAQGRQQAPPPSQHVENGVRLADGQRRHEDQPA
jgi:type IV secretory pathway VirB4 component